MKIPRTLLPYLVPVLVWAAATGLARILLGPLLAPDPWTILKRTWELASSLELFRGLGTTVARGLMGALLANVCGVALGALAGRAAWALRLAGPLVAGIQSCPPIVWITLVMVWAGTGALVPVAAVFAATVPFVFSNTAQGVMGIPDRLLAVGRLYGVPRARTLLQVAAPAVLPYYLAGLSTVLATAWKAAAVAEYMGSPDGAGAAIYWSYSRLNMTDLNAWALSLVALGLALEALVITPLRRRAARMTAEGA
ncbi:MAG: ABC transporter permease subunit [Deltaproteobacteria bacterium]|nr:ABC transporter permease subunit [Deltaproteobacteria bacterium]